MPSVLRRCWLGGRKGIRSVKNWVVGLAWVYVWSDVQICIWPSWCHCHSPSLAPIKSRLVLPFRYRLTWVVPEKGPLNVCVCVWLAIWQNHEARSFVRHWNMNDPRLNLVGHFQPRVIIFQCHMNDCTSWFCHMANHKLKIVHRLLRRWRKASEYRLPSKNAHRPNCCLQNHTD